MSSKAKHVLSHLIRLINNGIVVFLCPQYDQERKKNGEKVGNRALKKYCLKWSWSTHLCFSF